jgi:hypothetical protein
MSGYFRAIFPGTREAQMVAGYMVPIRIFLAVLPYRAGYLGTDIDVAQDPHTPVIKGLACHRQVDTSGRPDKQLNAEFALKRPDLRRQGRLGDMHPGCRPTEMELLGNRNEIADLAEFHGRRPYNG